MDAVGLGGDTRKADCVPLLPYLPTGTEEGRQGSNDINAVRDRVFVLSARGRTIFLFLRLSAAGTCESRFCSTRLSIHSAPVSNLLWFCITS